MGLRFGSDLEAWQRWDAGRRRVRNGVAWLRRRGRPEANPDLYMATRGEAPSVAVMLESRAASSQQAFLTPTAHLDAAAVYASFDPTDYLPGDGWQVRQVPGLELDRQVPEVRTVVASGSYLDLGGEAHRQAQARDLRFVVVQHGLLTPYAPPLPPGAHLLAWSDADAAFWRSGRSDVTTATVGSQLLWEAARQPRVDVMSSQPVFLGQLHGAELPRTGMTRAAVVFCRMTGATYRPHPSERDLLSRLEHKAFGLAGMEVDHSPAPLASLARPVAAAYSTGLLEAAARGLPAWAFYPSPPRWLEEFWERYGLSVWGGDPTPAPDRSAVEPARTVSRGLLG